jgi:GNAT superfamily N-acetyltransferase
MATKRRRTSKSKLSVHKAGLRDLDALVHQRRAMWEALGIRNNDQHEKGDRVYKQWARARLKNHELMAWVVKSSDGRIAGGGCVWLQTVQPRPHRASTVQPYLLSMYTEPDFRRRGVASMVVNEAIKWSRRNKYERLMLHASEMGRKVYSKLGFKRTWEMRLDLAH